MCWIMDIKISRYFSIKEKEKEKKSQKRITLLNYEWCIFKILWNVFCNVVCIQVGWNEIFIVLHKEGCLIYKLEVKLNFNITNSSIKYGYKNLISLINKDVHEFW